MNTIESEIAKQRVPRLSAWERWFNRNLKYLLVAPAALLLLSLIIYPLVFNLNMSFYRVTLLNIRDGWEFVGADHYISLLENPAHWRALNRTFVFLILTVGIQLIVGMIAALAFNVNFRGKNPLMTLALVPMLITPVAVGLFWRMMLNTEWGIVNYYVQKLGFERVVWLGTPTMAFITVILVEIWWGLSFVILVLLGGLSALPVEPFEAAEIDGASGWQQFRYLTLPLLKPVILVITTIRAIDAFRAFDLIFTLTKGGPADATRVYSIHIYYEAFERTLFGQGAASSMFLFGLVLLLSSGLIRGLVSDGEKR